MRVKQMIQRWLQQRRDKHPPFISLEEDRQLMVWYAEQEARKYDHWRR